MALPTASTYGYGFYPTVGPTPDVACNCLRAWLPVFRRLIKLKGLGDVDVWQCTGGLDSSAGTHSRGGAFDYSGIDTAKAMVAREMGAYACWPRNWTGNRHTHGVLSGCPHNDPCAYQLVAMRVYRKNGLGYRGLAGPDPLPPPSRYRTWQEGITWARARIAELEDPLSALSDDQQRALLKAVTDTKNRVFGMLHQRYYIIKDGAAVPVSKTTMGAKPARALDSLDGDYLRRQIQALKAEVDALKGNP